MSSVPIEPSRQGQPSDIGLPDKLSLNRQGSTLQIVRRWFGSDTVLLTLFALVWNVLLVLFCVAAFSTGNGVMVLFTGLHLGAGLWMAYRAAAGYVNRTYITVTPQTLSVIHHPLPYWGNRKIGSTEVAQLYSKEVVARGRRSASVTFEVHATTTSGRNVRLVRDLATSEQALYVEQEIEKFLRIPDHPVRGEIHR